MAEKFKFSVELTRREIATYNLFPIRWILWLDGLGIVAWMCCLYFSIFHADARVRDTMQVLLFWGALILAVGLWQPLMVILQVYVLRNPALRGHLARRVYTFNDEGISIESGDRSATTPWSNVKSLRQIGRMYLISTTPKLGYLIPQRYFSSDDQRKRFIELLSRNIESLRQKTPRLKTRGFSMLW